MVAHRSHTDLFASADVFENQIDDAPGGTLLVDRSDFTLTMVGAGDRTLPSATGLPYGMVGTIINGHSATVNVVGNDYLAGSVNTTTAQMPADSYIYLKVVTSNENSEKHWRVLWSGGSVSYA